MIKAIIFWSNDNKFYETLLGDDDLTSHIFIKFNNDNIKQIIDKFGLHKHNNMWIKIDGDKCYACASICVDNDKLNSAVIDFSNCISCLFPNTYRSHS